MKRTATLALLALLALSFGGCLGRKQALANSAASIYEAARAIETGRANQPAALQAIKTQAAAIIRTTGYTYAPAGVTE